MTDKDEMMQTNFLSVQERSTYDAIISAAIDRFMSAVAADESLQLRLERVTQVRVTVSAEFPALALGAIGSYANADRLFLSRSGNVFLLNSNGSLEVLFEYSDELLRVVADRIEDAVEAFLGPC